MVERPSASTESGFSLVEVVVVVVLLGLVAVVVYVGARGAVRVGEAGRRKAEAVAVMKAVAEDLSGRAGDLASAVGAGERGYAGGVGIPSRYEAKYTVTDTGMGTWRLDVRVVRDGDTLASDALFVHRPVN